MKLVLVLTFVIIMAELHLPTNRLLLICKCRFWRFLKVDRVKSTFIHLLKKIDQIDQIDRIDQIDFYAVPIIPLDCAVKHEVPGEMDQNEKMYENDA